MQFHENFAKYIEKTIPTKTMNNDQRNGGRVNCAEFFRNPYGLFEDEDSDAAAIEAALEASPGIFDGPAGQVDDSGSREPVILNVYDMFWTNDYTGNMGLGVYHSGLEV